MPGVTKDSEQMKKTSKSKATTTVKKQATNKSTKNTKSAVKKSVSKTASTKKTTTSTVKKRRTKINKVPSLATRRRSKTSGKKISKDVKDTINAVDSTNNVTEKNNFANILEYYDLPYRYNETVVKILAQTPKILFVYWDISDDDREKYKTRYGEYFFNDTYPVLVVHNKTLNYYQEVEINDFANSWYLSIPDSRSEYNVELGRRFKEYAKRNPNMTHKEDIDSLIEISYSNDLIMPNDHVLLDEMPSKIKYRNVKTNKEFFKDTRFVLAGNKLIDFYNLYKEIYQVEDLSHVFNLTNPTSGNPTSTFK